MYIFEKKIPTINFRTLTKYGFNFIEFYFRYINWKKKLFEQSQDSYCVKSFDLVGLNTLWQIITEAENAAVSCFLMASVVKLSRLPYAEGRQFIFLAEAIKIC